MEVFTLIARKKNVALVFVSYLLVALAAISLLTICIGFAPGILFAVVFGLIAYLMIMAQNTEFEYSYFDGELRFAKIKNKSRRKRLGIYSMESVAAIAPAGDRPDSFIFGDAASVWDVDLVVSGHDHGGQVVVPFAGGVFGGDQGYFPKYVHGMYEKERLHLFVSSGLGSANEPLPRVNNLPEVAVVEIEKSTQT